MLCRNHRCWRLWQWYDDLYVRDRKVSRTAVSATLEPVLVDPVQQYYSLALLRENKNYYFTI